jgi:hypothetical protein
MEQSHHFGAVASRESRDFRRGRASLPADCPEESELLELVIATT